MHPSCGIGILDDNVVGACFMLSEEVWRHCLSSSRMGLNGYVSSGIYVHGWDSKRCQTEIRTAGVQSELWKLGMYQSF